MACMTAISVEQPDGSAGVVGAVGTQLAEREHIIMLKYSSAHPILQRALSVPFQYPCSAAELS